MNLIDISNWQNGIVYHGIRDSGVGIWADLSALVGNYVEVYGQVMV